MPIQEFIEHQLHAMLYDLTERIIAGEFGEMSNEELGGLPIFIFKVENYLIKALRLFFAERS